MQNESELKYWNAFSLIPEIGPIKFKKIIDSFSSIEEAYKAMAEEFHSIGFGEKTVEAIMARRQEINPDAEYEKVLKNDINIITIQNSHYPKLLKEIYAPPPMLYVRGNVENEELSIAIVGTRKFSLYGKQVAIEITEALCTIGITVVSGLAKGIDTFTHQICVKNKSRTLAVLGSGVDDQSIYPSINRGLAKEIKKRGAVLSEYPPGTLPLKQHFPARNRIISGLCAGVLVIEAPEGSGALITAKYALDQNREVFAIPGPIHSPNSYGPNRLIKYGAKLVSGIEDIIEELNFTANISNVSPVHNSLLNTLEPNEKIIFELLGNEPTHIDLVIKNSQLPTAEVNSLLTMLEIKGIIRNLGGMNYVLTK